jgi:hypothetical protein
VSPKRGDRAAPPPVGDEWDVRFATSEAASGWEDLCAQAPGSTRWAWDLMRSSPGGPETSRHSRLRGKLASAEYGGRELQQWEIEVTGAGRIFYLLDNDKHTVRIVKAGTGHPKVTDKRG